MKDLTLFIIGARTINRAIDIIIAPRGVKSQDKRIFINLSWGTAFHPPVDMVIPTIAPRIAWEVDTGSFRKVIRVIVMAADKTARKAVERVKLVNRPTVSITLGPSITAPSTTKPAVRIVANL